jgi:hypothetical protein
MPSNAQVFRASIVAIAWSVMALPVPSRGQMGMSGTGRSLGGYGAATIDSYYSRGGGAYLPYNGRAGGFVPYQGNGFSATPPPSRRLSQTPIGGVMMSTTPIGGASLSGSGGRGGAMGPRSRSVDRTLVPFGYEGGIGMGGGLVGTSMTRRNAARRSTGPGFGSPFRMPLSLPGGSSSMTMP